MVNPDGCRWMSAARCERRSQTAMRKAFEGSDGGCVFPGCDRPPGWARSPHSFTGRRAASRPLRMLRCCVLVIIHQVHADNHEVKIGFRRSSDGSAQPEDVVNSSPSSARRAGSGLPFHKMVPRRCRHMDKAVKGAERDDGQRLGSGVGQHRCCVRFATTILPATPT